MHAIERAKERYGIELNPLDLVDFQRQIKEGQAVRLGKVRKRVGKFLVDYRGKQLPVAYHRKYGVMSVLPPEAGEVQRYLGTGTRWIRV